MRIAGMISEEQDKDILLLAKIFLVENRIKYLVEQMEIEKNDR